jgi:hypothetical protein
MQPVVSTRPSSTSSLRDLHNDVTCTTRHRSSASFDTNWETLDWLASRWSKPLDLDACPTPSSSYWFCGSTDKPSPTWFWDPNQKTAAVILWAKSLNRSYWFWDSNWKTRRPWFWGSTKKLVLPVSLCTMQIAHSVTWHLDRPATEYLTCAWSSLLLCTRSPTPAMILVAARHVAPVNYTPRDKQTWFSTRIIG